MASNFVKACHQASLYIHVDVIAAGIKSLIAILEVHTCTLYLNYYDNTILLSFHISHGSIHYNRAIMITLQLLSFHISHGSICTFKQAVIHLSLYQSRYCVYHVHEHGVSNVTNKIPIPFISPSRSLPFVAMPSAFFLCVCVPLPPLPPSLSFSLHYY